MSKQYGFLHITGGQIIGFCFVIGLIGWAVIRGLEWLWPFIKALIHSATA